MKSLLLLVVALLASVTAKLTQIDDDPADFHVIDPLTQQNKTYDGKEKQKWIYYDNRTLNATELKAREKMWKIHLNVTIARGVLTGLRQGFYKDYTYKLKPTCFGRDTVAYHFYFTHLIKNIKNFNDFL